MNGMMIGKYVFISKRERTIIIVLTTMSTTTQSFSSSTTMYRTTRLAASTTFEPQQQQQQQRNEFELQLGRALDTLRSDYPNILHTSPSTFVYFYILPFHSFH